jgi:hypothetical protein
MAVLSALLRVLAASAGSGAIAWLTVAPTHVCDSATDSQFGWLLIFLPAAAGLAVSLRPYSAAVWVVGAMAASITVATVVIVEAMGDGSVSPSGSQCEPAPGGAVLLVPFTGVVVAVLVLLLYALGVRSEEQAR